MYAYYTGPTFVCVTLLTNIFYVPVNFSNIVDYRIKCN